MKSEAVNLGGPMTTLVLNRETEQMLLRDLVRQAGSGPIEVLREDGSLAVMVTPPFDVDVDYGPLLAEAEANIEELRRRAAHPGPWITTAELLAHLESLEAKQ
jgi:hypothetical protein